MVTNNDVNEGAIRRRRRLGGSNIVWRSDNGNYIVRATDLSLHRQSLRRLSRGGRNVLKRERRSSGLFRMLQLRQA